MNKLLICLSLCFALAISQQVVSTVNHPVGVFGDQDCTGVQNCIDLLENGIFQGQQCLDNGFLWSCLWWKKGKTGLPDINNYNFKGSAWDVKGVCATSVFGGSVSQDLSSTDPDNSLPVIVTISPNAYYQIEKVLANGNEVTSDLVSGPNDSATYTINAQVSSPVNIDVYFSNKNGVVYDVYAQGDNYIKVSPSGLTMVNAGSSQTFLISSDYGYCFVTDIKVNGESQGTRDLSGNTFTINNVQSTVEIYVQGDCSYRLNPLQSKTNCTTTPSHAIYVNTSQAGTFHFDAPEPEDEYHRCWVGKITADNQVYGGDNKFTFSNVTQDHYVQADCYCTPVYYEVTLVSDSCTTQQSFPAEVIYGGSLAVSVTSNCVVNGLQINGTDAFISNSFTISPVWGPTVVSANCTCTHLQDCPVDVYYAQNTYDSRYQNRKITFNGEAFIYRSWNKGVQPKAGQNDWGAWRSDNACQPRPVVQCSDFTQYSADADHYNGKQQVAYKNNIYEALYWTNSVPDSFNGWNAVQPCLSE